MKLSIKTVLLGGFLGLLLFSITTILASSYITSERVKELNIVYDALIKAADNAIYRAKDLGQDKVS